MEPTPEQITVSPKAGAKKSMAWLLVVMAIAVAAVVAIVLFRTTGNNHASGVAATGQVVITKDGFSPATIRIKKGATVSWSSQDTQPHQVQADQASLADTLTSEESLGQGDTYSFTFENKGTFTYHDPLNPTVLKGTVIVE